MKRLILIPLLAAALLAQTTTLPTFTLKDTRNRQVQLRKARAGKTTLINFWASYCVPCRKEMPLLDKLQTKYAEKNFQILGIAIDDSRTVGRVGAVLRAVKVEYPILLDTEQKLYKNFNTSAMPYSILVDSEGIIVWQHTGYIPGDEKKMEAEIV